MHSRQVISHPNIHVFRLWEGAVARVGRTCTLHQLANQQPSCCANPCTAIQTSVGASVRIFETTVFYAY